jgi:predicted ArsR family transcriptional regulator
LRAVEVAGRKIGRELAPSAGPGSPEKKMHAALGSLGFAPRREADGATLRYRLCNCPYRDVVSENQPVVCTLHRGMTRGLLDGLAPTTTLADFVPRDPYTAGCLIEVQGELAEEGIARLDLEAAADPSES